MLPASKKAFKQPVRLVTRSLVSLWLALPLATVHAAELLVREAKAIATVPGQPVAAAYMMLSSKEDAELVSMSSNAAARVELHRMDRQGDITRMRRVQTLALRAGETISLSPGGLHLMLMDLNGPLQAGQQIGLEFVTVDREGRRTITPIVVTVVKEVPR